MAASVRARLRAALFAVVAITLTAEVGGAGYAAAAVQRPSDEPVAIGSSGSVLPLNPVLVRGEQVVVRAVGFAANTTVAVRLAGTVSTTYTVADSHGALSLRYIVDPRLADGTYVLTLVGAPDAPMSRTSSEHDAPPIADDSPIALLVPRVWLFHFRVAATTGTHQPTGQGTGGVAYTGVDIAALLALGVVVIAIGVLIVRTARGPRTDPAA